MYKVKYLIYYNPFSITVGGAISLLLCHIGAKSYHRYQEARSCDFALYPFVGFHLQDVLPQSYNFTLVALHRDFPHRPAAPFRYSVKMQSQLQQHWNSPSSSTSTGATDKHHETQRI